MGPANINNGQSGINPFAKTGIDQRLIISLKPVLNDGRIDLPVIDVIDQVIIVKIFRLQGWIYPVYSIVQLGPKNKDRSGCSMIGSITIIGFGPATKFSKSE